MAVDVDAADGELIDAEPWPVSGVRPALLVGLVALVALAGLVGWLGFRAHQSEQAEHRRALLVEVGRQAAVNLTTISYTEADADVQRILDSATGTFHDDFAKRSPAFIDVVKKAQSSPRGRSPKPASSPGAATRARCWSPYR